MNGIYQIASELLSPIKEKIIRRLDIDDQSKKYSFLQITVTFLLINFSWVFFRAESLSDTLNILRQMFSVFNPWIFFDQSMYTMGLNQEEFLVAVNALVILIIVDLAHYKGFSFCKWIGKQGLWIRWSIYYLTIFIILRWGVYGMEYQQSQFIYSNFPHRLVC
ncbi:hypothetical protein AALD22_05035 [Lachnospiraceae bacterium 56-18]